MDMKNTAQGRSVSLLFLYLPSPLSIVFTVFSIVRVRKALVNILIFLLYRENMFTVEKPDSSPKKVNKNHM